MSAESKRDNAECCGEWNTNKSKPKTSKGGVEAYEVKAEGLGDGSKWKVRGVDTQVSVSEEWYECFRSLHDEVEQYESNEGEVEVR